VTHSGNKVLSDRTITQQVVNGNITTTTTTRQRDNFE
jgi:hypothetical protein